MAMSFLAINAYKKLNRVIVQYYDSGSESQCHCPECDWRGDITQGASNELGCTEIHCPRCQTALAMISSMLPRNWSQLRCI